MPTKHAPPTEHDIRPTEVTVHLEPGMSLGLPNTAAEVATVPAGVPDPTHTDAAGGAKLGVDADMSALVRDASALLGPRTSELIQLSVIQGLADSEVGARVGIRDEIVSTTVARTRERVAEALAISVLVKTRMKVCPGLRRVVGAHARASLEVHVAEVVATHLDACTGCADAWMQIPPPLEVLRHDQAPGPMPSRDRLWDRIPRWIFGDGHGPQVRTIQAAGAVAVIALTLGVIVIMDGGGEPTPETPRNGQFLALESASPNPESVAPAQSPGTTVPKQPNSTVAAKTKPTVAANTKPASTTPTSTQVLPSEPPLVAIISPLNGQVFTSTFGGQPIDLVAVVQDDVDKRLAVDWFEGSTFLGSGNPLTVTSADGCQDSITYNVSAKVTDSSGNTSVGNATFTVRCEDPAS